MLLVLSLVSCLQIANADKMMLRTIWSRVRSQRRVSVVVVLYLILECDLRSILAWCLTSYNVFDCGGEQFLSHGVRRGGGVALQVLGHGTCLHTNSTTITLLISIGQTLTKCQIVLVYFKRMDTWRWGSSAGIGPQHRSASNITTLYLVYHTTKSRHIIKTIIVS